MGAQEAQQTYTHTHTRELHALVIHPSIYYSNPPYCHTITGRNQNTGGSPVFWAAWLMDDRCNSQQRKVQRIREKLKLPINHFPCKHWTRIQKEHRKKISLIIKKKVKRIKHAQKSGAHLSVGQTKDFFPVHCPHSESELCFFICSAQISLKFNCIKTPQRLSEVSLCKLQLLQLYRRLVVKVEAHLKLSVLGSAWSSAPFSTPFSEEDDIIPLAAFKESAVHYLGPFLIPRDWICKNKHSWEPHNRSSHKSFVCDYLKQLIWFSSLLLPIK